MDYCFGDGFQRLHRLMAGAFQDSRDLPQECQPKIFWKSSSAANAAWLPLSGVNPFYCYEVQIRAGRVEEQAWDADLHATSPAAWMHYRQLDGDSYFADLHSSSLPDFLRLVGGLVGIGGALLALEIKVEHLVEDLAVLGAPLANEAHRAISQF
ncbi:hypothetical protein ACQEU3_18865 [Spirillospora sp. CA-253888]